MELPVAKYFIDIITPQKGNSQFSFPSAHFFSIFRFAQYLLVHNANRHSSAS
jgi:hypothetical protein